MICNCECGCRRQAEGAGIYPTLCDVCGLTVKLNGSKCALPYTPPVFKPLDPIVPVTNAQKDAAIQEFFAENGL